MGRIPFVSELHTDYIVDFSCSGPVTNGQVGIATLRELVYELKAFRWRDILVNSYVIGILPYLDGVSIRLISFAQLLAAWVDFSSASMSRG